MSLKEDIDLDVLDIGPPAIRVGPGRRPAQITAEFVRELTPADLATPPTAIQKAPSIKKIRDSHHALARTLAATGSEGEASVLTGFSLSRISVLKADPQFQELLQFYREENADLLASLRERMLTMGLDALNELQERLDENPDLFSVGQLRELVKDMADRTGHAPQRGPASVTNVRFELNDAMAKARERVAQRLPGRTIDHE